MDNLSIGTLIILVFTYNINLALILFISLFGTGLAELNHNTLFCFTSLVLFYLLGIYGMIVTVISSILMLVSGGMYWYDFSYSDLKNKMSGAMETFNSQNATMAEVGRSFPCFNLYKICKKKRFDGKQTTSSTTTSMDYGKELTHSDRLPYRPIQK